MNNESKDKERFFSSSRRFFVVALVIIVSLFLLDGLSKIYIDSTNRAVAGTEHSLSGYAWSDNIGWVSLNCTNTNSCGSGNYGVSVDNGGNFFGYAWSDNIGWVSFNSSDTAGCPQAPCTAKVNRGSNGQVTGWARALSASGGWDGWIELGGPWASSLTFNLNNSTGYSWGSDVVGWLSWSGSGYGVTSAIPLSNQVPTAYIDSPAPPSVDISTLYPTTPIIFSGHGTDPEDGTTNDYKWYESTDCTGSVYSTAQSFSRTYPGVDPGTYHMSLKVTDSQGATSCPVSSASISVVRSYKFVENGECGSADGVSTSKTPTTGLCSIGVPNPPTLSGNGPWTWDCEDIYGSTDHCSAANSCGQGAPPGDAGVCQPGKGETPASCKVDCPLNFREF